MNTSANSLESDAIEFSDLCLDIDNAIPGEVRRTALFNLLGWVLDNQDSIYDALVNRAEYTADDTEPF